MYTIAKRLSLIWIAPFLSLCVCGAALAQGFPAKPITVIVPAPEGGPAHGVLRLIAQKVTENTGQQIVVDSRGGGNGTIGVMAVKQAPADGSVLLLGHPGTLVVLPLLAPLPYDPVADFRPVTSLAFYPSVLLVPASSPAKSVAELVALARSKPGGLFYGHNGIGGAPHLVPEMFKLAAGIPATMVPYKGMQPATTDLIAGRVDFLFAAFFSTRSHVEAGRLRVLAVASPQRMESSPQIATMAEAGFPSVELDNWFGLSAPAGTPVATIQAIYREFAKAMGDAGVRQGLALTGNRAGGQSPEEFGNFLAAERLKMEKLIKAAGIKAE